MDCWYIKIGPLPVTNLVPQTVHVHIPESWEKQAESGGIPLQSRDMKMVGFSPMDPMLADSITSL